MLDTDKDGDEQGSAPSPHAVSTAEAPSQDTQPPAPTYNESLVEELGAVIDDAKLYATAELAFQKTRAKILGKSVGIAAGAIVLALILLHVTIIALAVGLVLALQPLVGIWGAIAIVVGVMLIGVAALVMAAGSKGRLISEMFASDEPEAASPNSAEDSAE